MKVFRLQTNSNQPRAVQRLGLQATSHRSRIDLLTNRFDQRWLGYVADGVPIWDNDPRPRRVAIERRIGPTNHVEKVKRVEPLEFPPGRVDFVQSELRVHWLLELVPADHRRMIAEGQNELLHFQRTGGVGRTFGMLLVLNSFDRFSNSVYFILLHLSVFDIDIILSRQHCPLAKDTNICQYVNPLTPYDHISLRENLF